MKNDINAGTASRLLQFADAMDAMKLAGGQIYYFVLDYDSDSSVWDKVLYAFEQMFSYLDTQLLIIDIPEKYTRRKDFEQVNAVIDRFCIKCQGIIKYVNENGAESTLFKHIGVYISGNDVKLAPYIKKAKESGIIIKKASDWVKDFSDSPFLTKSGSRKPLISICIPTFNRAGCLILTIESIIKQNEFKRGLVEIVISDNNSDDETEKIGRFYADQFSMIRYFRNDKNILDGNFRLVLKRGSRCQS
ncbi:MAG: glycosyltransferase [Lachnospiraceae bacterium]|uniref:Glycosyltransferase family 2 protein n=1 Tax=Candidatus Weimeria bifida TaxID=2599074 RepID=A0A6N7IZJ8_9FIRM|nr:glycosyltransferase family 2 protein [Candidatus Weimeria bifida]RRF96600.1 MAG: glycosyltransferase [Lachnospiraceae bacterium]